MTDHDANHAQHHHDRQPARGSGSRERRSMGSYETGESSTMGRLTSSLSMTDTTLTQRSSSEMPATSPSASHGSTQDNGQGRREERRRSHRTNKNRSSGAFLLSGALDGSPRETHEAHKRHQARRHQVSDVQEQQNASTTPDRPQESDTIPVRTERHTKQERLSVPGSQQPASHGDTPPRLPSQASNTLLDLDSTQIVNMALNLSESRRLAARRNVSHPLPPRLAPLPDSSVGGSLRQQLQQQRRTSRTVSPKPDRGSRIVSGPRLSSPLQSTFDPIDGSYRYHFSQSTLSRAQKAKDYLELLAQYRRVLELVPPLKPDMMERIATTSPPGSPAHTNRAHYFGTTDPGAVTLGREYNPLQYIRNRKVRARERKAIDGEGQGFGDLTRVTDWVDGVAKWAATGQSQTPGGTLLPPFAGADETLMHSSPPSNSSRPSVVVNKPKRPRVDWVIDPADMLADVYWLEQGDNKKLVEDRDWHRVFPQDPEIYRPISQQTEDGNAATAPNLVKKAETIPIVEKSIADTNSPRAEQERTRKTRHKLQHLRGRHHRQGSSVASNDIYRSRKASFSDTSDSDSDPKPRRRRVRQDTITAGGKDILEKQMAEMIALEEREKEARESYELELQRTKSTNNDLTTPDRPRSGSSTGPSRGPSRRGSHGAEHSGSDEKLPIGRPELGSPIKTGRASLEVPEVPLTGRRLSVDYNVSQPPSPGIRPIDVGFVPGIGADFTPSSSRPGSPPRNPFSKVKNIFRDRSRERSMDRSNDIQDRQEDAHAGNIGGPVDTPATLSPTQTRVERRPSRSPARKIQSKGTDEGHKAHRSIGSMRLRSEESSGLRSLLKTGPRIDSVLRNGVSKVSELFWRKEDDDQTSNTSSSESEDEAITRGRSRGSAVPSRATSQRRNDETLKAKHYLSVMPTFQSTMASHDRLNARDQSPISRPPSRRSSRFDLLKPPKIDIQSASPSDTPPRELSRTRDVSTSQSRKGSIADDNSRAAGARLNHVLCLPEPLATQRSRHLSASSHGTRHWSLSDRSPSPHPAQDASQLSRREVARLRAMILGSGIVANEIARRVNEPRLLPEASSSACSAATTGALRWAEIVALSPQRRDELAGRPVSQRELYTAAARVLGQSVQASGQRWQASADRFAGETTPALRERVECLRGKLAADLSGLTRAAADEADGVVNDLLEGQRLKVKRVVDVIDKMSRRRRRRFRWVRRAGWLGVEWMLVGFMWYVWFVVMIARVVWGVGSGLFAGVRWLLWL